MVSQKPIILLSKEKVPRAAKRSDILAVSHEELFAVRHPWLAKTPFKTTREWKDFLHTIKGRERWVYWPGLNVAVRMLDEELYFELRTARNRNLITQEEQKAYRDLSIGIGGLSVGSSILSSLVLTGGPKRIKIADFDVLAPSNLNRIRAGIPDVGSEKIDLAARDIWRVDPFAELGLWRKGLTEENIEEFMLDRPRLDLFIDEMDSLALKVAARIIAKRERMPVVMATDNGDGVLIDVERFDLEPKRKIFHGLVGDLTLAKARVAKGPAWVEIVEKIIGGPWMPKRHRESLRELGKTLAGVPQLGTDAMSAGVGISLAIRRIASGESMPSGRYVLAMDKVLGKPVVH